jgi:hypothetical protein
VLRGPRPSRGCVKTSVADGRSGATSSTRFRPDCAAPGATRARRLDMPRPPGFPSCGPRSPSISAAGAVSPAPPSR